MSVCVYEDFNKECNMKQILIPALSLAMLAASVGAGAHMLYGPQSDGQPGPGHQAMLSPEMRALHEEMQGKMAAAKTPEERHALMAQQQEKMREKMPGMANGQMGQMGRMGGMGGMGPMGMRHHQPMMLEQRPASGG